MNPRLLPSLLTVALLAPACANRPVAGHPTEAGTTGASIDEAVREAAAPAAPRRGVLLPRSMHEAAMGEVVLDPRGNAALTLDVDGGVRLWTDLRASAPLEPLALPVHDPASMSLARVADGFVVAFLDTAGGARVGRVNLDGDRARWVPTFDVAPEDALLELHVLDDDGRVLALGVDHRIHLWSRDGKELAGLDRPGFVPWQLRVAQSPGEPPAVLAVLASPVRVQPLKIGRDRIEPTGNALSIALDRGPNRNDLALTPDGRTVLALRRSSSPGLRVEVELVDVATGSRRIIAAELDTREHPRLHPLGGDRVLFEIGSGRGLMLDLSGATAWPPPEGEPDRAALPAAIPQAIDLPASTAEARMHAVVVAGTRAVPTAEGLVVDPLASDRHRTLERRPFEATAAALDDAGERIAWGTADAIVIEPVDGSEPPRTLPASDGGAILLGFVTDDRLVALAPDGTVSLRRLSDGEEIAHDEIPFAWGIRSSAWRRTDTGGDVVLTSLRPAEPLHVLGVSATELGHHRAIDVEQRSAWPEGGRPQEIGEDTWRAGLGVDAPAVGLRPLAELRLNEPDPTDRRIALVQRTRRHEGFDEASGQWVVGPHDYVVTVYDRQTGARWTEATLGLPDLAWSRDGERLAIASHFGARVLEAATGELLRERRDLGLRVVESDDAG